MMRLPRIQHHQSKTFASGCVTGVEVDRPIGRRLFAAALLVLGCAVFVVVADEPPSAPGAPFITNIDGVELSFYPFGSVVRNRVWQTKQIPVCWDNPDAVEDQVRSESEKAIVESWARHSSLKFPGWKPCMPGELGVHIRIASELPHVRTIGRYLDGQLAGVVLNFDFGGWRPACSDSAEHGQRCLRAMIVHEFGHVIGFAHEQIRADAPAECKAEKRGARGTWNVTDYDPRSVMNYCNADWLGDGLLSNQDVLAVQTVYGR